MGMRRGFILRILLKTNGNEEKNMKVEKCMVPEEVGKLD